ncbi:ABC transporter permease [Pseudomonas sp. TMP9]|uniref:ABC transporter permease n=1 Tax=Pseudomonas sp. TMP9 TaxID=3133144 RepID=UPI0030CCE2E1
MYLLRLALASLGNRRFTAWLTVFAIALSVCLLLAVERVRTEARASFANTISGTDLIVGARSGSVNLLLYSVFRIGNATNNIRWDSFEHFAEHRQVKWAIPISLGDSHRGYRVMGTNPTYFEHYRYARSQPLQLSSGRAFADDPFEVVLGAEVAQALNYQLDQELVLAHGVATISLVKHDDKPFKVVGILKRTGTPVDRTLHISLPGMEALHVDWQNGMPARGAAKVSAEQVRHWASACSQASRAQTGQGESGRGSGVETRLNEHSEPAFNAAASSAVACVQALQPKQITAVLLGLNSRIATFSLQREINEFRGEPLLAILPGVALQELWSLMGTAEKALFVVSLFVVLTGLIGMLTAILTSLNERRREMAILRSVGARPWHIASLLIVEAFALALAGVLLGILLLYMGIAGAQGYIQASYGLYLPLSLPTRYEWSLLGAILGAALLMGCVPAWRAYRQSLADGLSIRL